MNKLENLELKKFCKNQADTIDLIKKLFNLYDTHEISNEDLVFGVADIISIDGDYIKDSDGNLKNSVQTRLGTSISWRIKMIMRKPKISIKKPEEKEKAVEKGEPLFRIKSVSGKYQNKFKIVLSNDATKLIKNAYSIEHPDSDEIPDIESYLNIMMNDASKTVEQNETKVNS